MTKILYREVDGCYDCPCLVGGENGHGDACFETGEFMPVDDVSKIPEWCPLKDKENK